MCRELGIGSVAYAPLGRGLLTDGIKSATICRLQTGGVDTSLPPDKSCTKHRARARA